MEEEEEEQSKRCGRKRGVQKSEEIRTSTRLLVIGSEIT
jgi:hypothetical protein